MTPSGIIQMFKNEFKNFEGISYRNRIGAINHWKLLAKFGMTFIRMKESIFLEFGLRRNNVDQTSLNENMFHCRLRFHSLMGNR